MDARRIKEEMQFLTNVVTNDVDYLLYLLLKVEVKPEPVLKIPTEDGNSFFDEGVLEDWFNKL